MAKTTRAGDDESRRGRGARTTQGETTEGEGRQRTAWKRPVSDMRHALWYFATSSSRISWHECEHRSQGITDHAPGSRPFEKRRYGSENSHWRQPRVRRRKSRSSRAKRSLGPSVLQGAVMASRLGMTTIHPPTRRRRGLSASGCAKGCRRPILVRECADGRSTNFADTPIEAL